MAKVAVQLLYPKLGTIEILSRATSQEELVASYVSDLSGNYLASRTHFIGRVFSIVRAPLELFGIVPPDGGVTVALRTAQMALERFREYLEAPTEHPEPFIETFLSVSYNDPWPERFCRAYQFFHPEEELPPMDTALCNLAPQVLHQVAASPVPFEALNCLVRKHQLSESDQRWLQQWIRDVDALGQVVSPNLILFFVREVVYRSHPIEGEEKESHRYVATTSSKICKKQLSSPAEEKMDLAFCLARELRQRGLRAVADDRLPGTLPEGEFPINVRGKSCPVLCHIGGESPVPFPEDFACIAYDVKECESITYIHATPLFLGVWGVELKRRVGWDELIPLPRVISLDPQRGFFVTDKLEKRLDDPRIWENRDGISEKDEKMCGVLAELVQRFCYYRVTFNVTMQHIFLTPWLEMVALKIFEEKLEYFHFPTIEKFVRTACCEKQERIAFVLRKGGILPTKEAKTNPFVQSIQTIIKKYCFSATPEQIRAIVKSQVTNEEYLAEIIAWHERALGIAQVALGNLRMSRDFSSRKRKEPLALLAEAFCALQSEVGFVMHLPVDLAAQMVDWLKVHHN